MNHVEFWITTVFWSALDQVIPRKCWVYWLATKKQARAALHSFGWYEIYVSSWTICKDVWGCFHLKWPKRLLFATHLLGEPFGRRMPKKALWDTSPVAILLKHAIFSPQKPIFLRNLRIFSWILLAFRKLAVISPQPSWQGCFLFHMH